MHSVFLHCSGSDADRHDDVAVILRWHRANGWDDVGYHYFVRRSGEVQPGRSLEQTPAAQRGHDQGTITICLHGGRLERFPAAQFDSLSALCLAIAEAYEPGELRFRGHCSEVCGRFAISRATARVLVSITSLKSLDSAA